MLFPLTVKVTSQLMYDPCKPERDRDGLEPSSLATSGAPLPRPAHLNFHCVRCGRGKEDGVKLHVDHIVPVSRGGKSVMDNLQTLCEDCNYGKGNKYKE